MCAVLSVEFYESPACPMVNSTNKHPIIEKYSITQYAKIDSLSCAMVCNVNKTGKGPF
jgi:hypothetical protein